MKGRTDSCTYVSQLFFVLHPVKMPSIFKKKSFIACKKYLFASLKASLKYINYGKKGALTIFDTGKAGLNCTGSKHLQEVFYKYKAEFEEAAKLDAKSLKNETPETAPPPPDTMPSAFSNFLNQPVKVKKLEQHLPIMVEQQVPVVQKYIVKLRSRSGEGQGNVRKVRVMSEPGDLKDLDLSCTIFFVLKVRSSLFELDTNASQACPFHCLFSS